MSVLTDLGKIVGGIAPSLAKAALASTAGPAGLLFGNAAIDILADALGLPGDDRKPEAVLKAIPDATPEQVASIKAADQAHAEKMKALNIQSFDIEVKDRKSARRMYAANRGLISDLLACALVFGFFGSIASLMFIDIPASSMDLLILLMGMMATKFNNLCSFYWGSSQGSESKSETINVIAKNGYH